MPLAPALIAGVQLPGKRIRMGFTGARCWWVRDLRPASQIGAGVGHTARAHGYPGVVFACRRDAVFHRARAFEVREGTSRCPLVSPTPSKARGAGKDAGRSGLDY